MRELTVLAKDEGQRLNKYLMRYLSSAPSSFVYKMLRKKNIVLNGTRAKGDEIIKSGDIVKLFLSDDTIENFRQPDKKSSDVADNLSDYWLDILYEDEDILAVNKPVGMLSQKAAKDDVSVNELIVSYCKKKYPDSEFRPSVCNRLDRNTSGIILAGITLKGSRELSKAFRERSLDKYYFTIVKGHMSDVLCEMAYICKDEKANKATVISESEYRLICDGDLSTKCSYDRIEAEFAPVSYKDGYTLIKVKLITGKSHQIRAQLAYLGYYIVGDNKYGDVTANRFFRDKYKLKYQLLHAGEVILGNGTRITAPLSDKFKCICEGLGLGLIEV